ncbi:ectonucleotide pyrophosphatase/phosphodiesterase [Actomonas aquatica]|uniref:Ectonucleotide pyrophosphatase/phosphodiesterase n=1 Tax=Actomonas aquatica TaxID=2866162 RepID=A0ABZ1CBU3_9BACT|nr:ectonucleotide pyrophosphatase/phosphodiesterase [Opitutus sp. WL0086]WRQ89031.1 ectonucleotide pyrophosphatase/phosphodiesterase [Opitutus sp. WL0086]
MLLRRLFAALSLLLLALGLRAEPLVIFVSIDGGRWDYPELHEASFLQEMSDAGTRLERLRPSYPSKTFPNHYTLVTGLRPESHGIIQNRFYDEEFNAWFGIGPHPAKREGRWWGGDPIWLTAQHQGLRTASLFWPGASADIHGEHPTYWRVYDGRLTPADRVQQVIDWVDLPAGERPQFIALYFNRVDNTGHGFGPTAPETRAALQEIDEALRTLRDALVERNQWADTHLVVTADHGMTATDPDHIIALDDLIDLAEVDIIFSGASGGLEVKDPTRINALVTQLDDRLHLSAYARANVPERLHFSHNARIPSIVLVPDLGWHVTTRAQLEAGRGPSPGDHGFDPAEPDMGAMFIGVGPRFRAGVKLPPADNIDVYNLLCALLEITPSSNEGSTVLVDALQTK